MAKKDDGGPKGFSTREIQQNFTDETRLKPKPDDASLSYARSRRNLSDALDSGRLDLYLQALDALGFVDGTPQRKQALQVFNNKHGL